jgi:hypothetical protein
MTIAYCIDLFLMFSVKFGIASFGEIVRQFPGRHEPARTCQAMVFHRGLRELSFSSITTQLGQTLYFVLDEASLAQSFEVLFASAVAPSILKDVS